MKPISELTTQPPQESSAQLPHAGRTSEITPAHIDRLWLRMTRVFGHRWVSSYGEYDDGTWLKGLADMTANEVRDGIAACLSRSDTWPPTLPEFRAMCRPTRPAYHRQAKMLPRPVSNPDIVKAAIGKMRAIIDS